MPDDAAITLGKTVVHLFSRDEAEAFVLLAPFYADGRAFGILYCVHRQRQKGESSMAKTAVGPRAAYAAAAARGTRRVSHGVVQ